MSRRRSIVLGLVFAGILISYVDRGNLSIATPTIMRDFNIAPAAMGMLLSAFFWTYGGFQIPAGLLVDRFGIRRTYAAAFFLWSTASAALALSRGFGDILFLRLLLGFAEAIGPLASLAFIRQNFRGPEQGFPVSIYIAGQTIGPAVGALLGTTLLVHFGWRFMFALTGLGALVWLPFWIYFAPRGSARETVRTETPPPPARRAWIIGAKSPSFWALAACVFFLSYYWYFVLTWMPAYLTMSRGFSTMGMGRILSAPLFAMAVFNVVGGWAADKLVKRFGSVFRVRILFGAAGLLGSASLLLLQVLPGRGPVLPILVLSICSFGIASSNFWAISQHVPPMQMVARTIGILNTLSQLAGALAPLITGWTLGPQKQFGVAVTVAGVCPLIACGLLLIAGPRGLTKLKQDLVAA